jgi:hypothetical protein
MKILRGCFNCDKIVFLQKIKIRDENKRIKSGKF